MGNGVRERVSNVFYSIAAIVLIIMVILGIIKYVYW